MLEYISLIASIISGLTAISSSLRAVGASREFMKNEASAHVKTISRIGSLSSSSGISQRSNMKLHFFVTSIWYLLSVLFVLPFYKVHHDSHAGILVYALPFLILAVILAVIWSRVLKNIR